MPYVITQACAGTCDTACVDVCPVDCIAGPERVETLRALEATKRGARFPTLQLFIDPDECTSCGACLPECPIEAIRDGDSLASDDPDVLRNAAFFASQSFKR